MQNPHIYRRKWASRGIPIFFFLLKTYVVSKKWSVFTQICHLLSHERQHTSVILMKTILKSFEKPAVKDTQRAPLEKPGSYNQYTNDWKTTIISACILDKVDKYLHWFLIHVRVFRRKTTIAYRLKAETKLSILLWHIKFWKFCCDPKISKNLISVFFFFYWQKTESECLTVNSHVGLSMGKILYLDCKITEPVKCNRYHYFSDA